MNKKQFKIAFEELVWTYLRDNRNKTNFPHCISCEYLVNEEHGEIIFYSDRKDVQFKIPKIDFKD